MAAPQSMRDAIANSKGFKGDPAGVAAKANKANPGDNISIVVNQREYDDLRARHGEPRPVPGGDGVMQFGYGSGTDGGRNEGAGAKADKDKSDRGGNDKGGKAGSDKGTADRAHQGSVSGISEKEKANDFGRLGLDGVKSPNASAAQRGLAEAEDPSTLGSLFSSFMDKLSNTFSTPTTPDEIGQAVVSAAMPGGSLVGPLGAAMGTQAKKTVDAINNGTLSGRVVHDDAMGDVGFHEGGSYSTGNPAADDRAKNTSGLGGGMVGGNGGNHAVLGTIGAKLTNPGAAPVVVPSFSSAKPPVNAINYGTPGASIYPASKVIT